MPRDAVLEWCAILKTDLERTTGRSHALEVDTQVLTAFEFYSSGSFQWMVGNASGITKASVSRALESVTNSICRVAPRYIHFPDHPDQLVQSKLEFNKLAQFPNVDGAIDGTHIPIMAPSAHEDAFVNRKVVHFKSTVINVYYNVNYIE